MYNDSMKTCRKGHQYETRRCSECARAYQKVYRQNHTKERSLYAKKYYEENKEDFVKRANSLEGRYSDYKISARLRKLDFTLTFDQFMLFWQKPCSYSGDSVETIRLDRIDSHKGYSIDNIVSCCEMCNYMKNNYTREEFLKQCKKIVDSQTV